MGFFRALILLLVTTSGLTPALAAEGDRVRVGGTCVPAGTSLDETLSILRAELAPIGVVPLDADPPPAGRTNVVIGIEACTVDPPAARVTVWTNGVPRIRTVSLADTEPDARDRTLALALAEATRDFALPVIEGRAETPPPDEQSPAPEPPPKGPPPADVAPRPRQSGRETASRSVVKAAALLRFVASPATVLGGGEVGLAWPRVAVSLSVLATGASVSIGDATLLAFYAAPSIDVLELGAGASLRVNGELGLAAGSGAAISPATGGDATGLHAGIGAGLSEKVPLGAGWTFDANVSAGYASSLILRASGSELIGLNGFFVAAAAGIRLPWAL